MTDIAGNITTQRMLRVGGMWSDTIELSGDQDWFRVWLVQGVTYHISLNSSGGAPLGDPLLRVLDGTGTVELSRDDDSGGGLNSLIDFTAAVTGTYFISAQAFGSATGQYTLAFTETDIPPAPASTNGTATTAVVAVDGFVRGTLQNIDFIDPLSGLPVHRVDSDWYRVDVQAGQEYNFVWTQAGANAATGVDITLYNSAGTQVFQLANPGAWDWSYINWIPGESGTWFIGVSGADTSGEYTLAVNHVTASPLEAITGPTTLQTNRVDVYFTLPGETFNGTTSEGWNDFEIAQAMAALSEFSNIANITFSRTTVLADAEFILVLDDNELTDLAGEMGVPGTNIEGIGTFDGNWAGWSTRAGGAAPGDAIDKGGYGWDTMLHEFGHGVGLTHPHDDFLGSPIMHGVSNADALGDFDLNQGIYTVMTYNSGWETAPQGEPTKPDGKLQPSFGWAGTPMALDIAAIQQKYGANTSFHTGNDTYVLPSADQIGTFYSSIWDAGGIDTIRAGATTTSCIIDLRAATLQYEPGGGGWVSYQAGIHGGFTIANGVVIENATGGAGDDRITGNAANNLLDGAGGNDTIDGGDGADSMIGGAGNDTYLVDNAGDGVVENPNEGSDIIFASVSYTIAANVETLVLQGTADLQGYGDGQANTLVGSSGNNLLDGRAGGDAMSGGTGNDTYLVDNAGDAVIENLNEGNDTILASVSYGLTANVETLVLQGSADLQGFGNGMINALFGNSGNNLLDGGGGADAMAGGPGNDTYIFDHAVDTASENANEGNDTVLSTVSTTLSSNIENLVLQGSADLQGYGSAQGNTLYGNAGNNLLNGFGGADLMVGGAGNDTYFADSSADACFETPGQGTDTVFASANYGISADVENLILQGAVGLQAYGNNQTNTIYGNTGDNLINGAGGIDLMVGGVGNDTYFVDNSSDSCFENPGEGNDAVLASVSYGLAADVETLVLQGSADLQGYGNNTANTLYGNAGNNLLNGGGGADTMAGAAGNDTYFVDNVGDGIVENANEGTDSVLASVSYALSPNVEALVLQGGANLSGIGNALNNSIFGNSGDNPLDGGAGADQLTGNAGNDIFVFRAGQANGDNITDFFGNGAAPGDSFQFFGFGTAGATFTSIGGNQWQIHSGLDGHNEVITLSNGASVGGADYSFA
jgi:Ca2+-binding RTX toxin-like protein